MSCLSINSLECRGRTEGRPGISSVDVSTRHGGSVDLAASGLKEHALLAK